MTRLGRFVPLLFCAWLSGCNVGPEAWSTPPDVDLGRMAGPGRELISERLGHVRELLERGGSPEEIGAAYGALGMALQAYADARRARDCYAYATELVPDESRWWYLLGLAESRLGNSEPATRALERYVRSEPRAAWGWTWLGDVVFDDGDFDSAGDHYRRALEVDPETARALAGLGRTALAQGRPREAVEWLESALDLQSHSAGVRVLLSQALSTLGETERAARHRKSFEQSGRASGRTVLIDPLTREVLELKRSPLETEHRGAAAVARGDLWAAVAEYRQSLLEDPGRTHVRHNLAIALWRLGRLDWARREMTAVLEEEPGHVSALLFFARDARRRGELREAAGRLEQALESDPRHPQVHVELGRVATARSEWARALGHFESAAKLDPTLREARRRIAETLVALGREDDAMSGLERSLESLPDSPTLAALLARLIASRPQALEDELVRALALTESVESVSGAESRAMVLARLGRFEEAVRDQRRALEAAHGASAEVAAERLARYERGLVAEAPWEPREEWSTRPAPRAAVKRSSVTDSV